MLRAARPYLIIVELAALRRQNDIHLMQLCSRSEPRGHSSKNILALERSSKYILALGCHFLLHSLHYITRPLTYVHCDSTNCHCRRSFDPLSGHHSTANLPPGRAQRTQEGTQSILDEGVVCVGCMNAGTSFTERPRGPSHIASALVIAIEWVTVDGCLQWTLSRRVNCN